MTNQERTRQQLDPPAALGSWPLTVLLALGAFGYAATMTVLAAQEIAVPALAVLSLLPLAAACATVVIGSSARAGRFGRRTHLLVHLLVWIAVILSAAAVWHTNRFVRDDWWPVTFGLLLLALGPYRPARELVLSGTVSALFLGLLSLLQWQPPTTPLPATAYALVMVSPMLALCFASAAFYRSAVNAVEEWNRQTTRAGAAMVDRFREGITRSVQQDRVTILSRDVLPYFSDILAAETITEADRARALDIANSIRQVMVAEADRSWLEGLVDTVAVGGPIGRVSDEDRLAPQMNREQRTILRALLVALCETPGFDSASARFRLAADGGFCRVTMSGDLAATQHAAKSLVAPYLAVMRVSFTAVRIDSLQPTLTIGFSYELH
jgi:hypothetical protein